MEENKYRVGDKVIISIKDKVSYPLKSITPSMYKNNGKILTIINVRVGGIYQLEDRFYYSEDMLLPCDAITEEDVLVLASKVIKKHLSIDRSFEMIEGKESWVAINFSIGQQDFLRKEVVKGSICDFIRGVVKYYPDITNSWYVKTKEDLYKVLMALYRLSNKDTDKHTIRETEELANKIGRELLDSNDIFIVTQKSGTFSVNYSTNETNKIFELILLENMDDFLKQVVGYNPSRGNYFPEFNYLEDLYKVLEAILARWEDIVKHKMIKDPSNESYPSFSSDKEKLINKIETIVNSILRNLSPDKKVIGKVFLYNSLYYIWISREFNSFIFGKLHILDPMIYIRNLLGYTPDGGDFPPVKTLEDLYRVVCDLAKRTDEFLNKDSSKEFPKIGIDPSLTLAIREYIDSCASYKRDTDLSKKSNSDIEGSTIKYPSNKNRVVRLNFKY